EDKVVRFADKTQHQLFVEPEGWRTVEVYLNGLSSSMPEEVQARALAQPGTIPALQSAIAQASQVQLGRALRVEAQTLIAEWQQEIQVIEDRPILEAAVALADQGNLQDAITEAQKIQPNRALHSRAQTLIQDWTTAIQVAEDQPILDKAKNLAYSGRLTAAINLASQIAPGRALYGEAKRAIALWKAERDYIWSIWEAEGRSGSARGEANRSGSPSSSSSDSE
ncbi:MAG TPA: FAD-dependent oxidoreductase, partial [Leptolyngbyaceae cyanobacterium M65_K2018_010]|nr:FAD-dependent oxidoreductase [Leptolyngbyaceae cyanobacterium M65_K2018_010]